MQTKYHIEITRRALEDYFSDKALKQIISANIRQDRISYMLGHDYIHFDGSAFEEGFQYISSQEDLINKHIEVANYDQARDAFGRIIHSWQDFYSHSNYILLWKRGNQNSPPESIDINDPMIINHPEFESGKNYGVIEFIAMIPGLSGLITPLMPPDSHAMMNLDAPSSGTDFAYAYWAALKQTCAVYEDIIQQLISRNFNQNIISLFKDK
jgi:hypothetical protein